MESPNLADAPARPLVVVVEDNPGDTLLIREVIREQSIACRLLLLPDGERAIRFFESINGEPDSHPHLVLLDLNLPKYSGHEVLACIRRSAHCATVPVVVFTSSESPLDLAENARLGATAYFRKPGSLDGYMQLGDVFRSYLSTKPRA